MDEDLAARVRAAELVAAAGTDAWPAARSAYGELLERELLDRTAERIERAADRDAVRRAELDAWQPRIEELIRDREPARRRLAELGDRLRLPRPELVWARMVVQPAQVAAGLDKHPTSVRRDLARLAQALVRETRERWTPFGGVDELWAFLDDSDRIRVERNRGPLLPNEYEDSVHTAGMLPGVVAKRLGHHRCVALVYGNHRQNWRLPLMPSTDDAAIVRAVHHSGAGHEFYLWFTRHGVLRPRIRFAPGVDEIIDRAAAG